MKNSFILPTILIVILSYAIPSHLVAETSTFAFKLNGHKYNQSQDLMIRAIDEWFFVAMDSLDLPGLLDTLAGANDLTITELTMPEFVTITYDIDESGTFDFLTNILMDTLSVSATGLGCEFEIDIIGAGFVLRGVSSYLNGEFKIELGEPDTLRPEILVVGTGHILCPGLAGVFKAEMSSEVDSLLISIASLYESGSFDNLLTFLNPIQTLGLKDSVLIHQALESFPMDMDLYTEEDPIQDATQLIIEINFLLGTVNNPQAFVEIEPSEITDSQLKFGGFSFLYWVLQKGFPWHEDWTDLQRVSTAQNTMEEKGFSDYRLELRWSDLQKLAYLGGDLDPSEITSELIDDYLQDTEHWDTTAFSQIEEYLSSGFTQNLNPFMAIGVGHEDRMVVDQSGLRIAPASEGWDAPDGYIGISSPEYLYNLKIYAHATIRRYADQIDIWQIENELNAAGFAAAVPEWWRKGDLWADNKFVNQVWKILVDAVRLEDPTAKIIHDFHMLGFMQSLEDWVDDLDIVGVNYYPNQVASLPLMGFTIGEYVWAVRRALKGLGYEDIPVWLTETGYPGIEIEDPSENIILVEDIAYFSENRQADYIETALSSAVAHGAEGFFYYSLVTQDNYIENTPMRFSGMVRRETDIFKPALQIYADLFKSLHIIPTGIIDDIQTLPKTASLDQNYPNPFNPLTVIRYQLSVVSNVTLDIYNVRGQKVETLVSEKQSPGSYQIEWDGGQFSSGVYYYIFQTGEVRDVKKMILLK